jgi:hypothetical protein
MSGPRFLRFGGIDFSGAKEPVSNLWSALGREADGTLVIDDLRPHAFRADLAAWVAGGWRFGDDAEVPILWGADFPFGLPADSVAALLPDRAEGGWEAVLAWVADRPADELRDALPDHRRATRVCDGGGALAPLDLRLYKQTAEGLRWLHELREETDVSVIPHGERAGADTVLMEVYPSGAAKELGLPRRRAPGRPGEVRARAAALRTFLRFSDPCHEAVAVTLEDAWDATIACLAAWMCRDDLDQPTRRAPDRADQVRVEGWMYMPPAVVPAGAPNRSNR